MSVRVQCVLSDDEYKQLNKILNDKGISWSKYIKDKLFPPEIAFEIIWNSFHERLEKYPTNIEFTVANIMGQDEWNKLDKSSKLSLSRSFNKKVVSGEYDNIRLVGRSQSNVSVYLKVD